MWPVLRPRGSDSRESPHTIAANCPVSYLVPPRNSTAGVSKRPAVTLHTAHDSSLPLHPPTRHLTLPLMDRIEIEVTLNRDRAWLLETLSAMSEEELYAPRTPSEHDPSKTWSFADHFVHTTLIEQDWNAMFRRHVAGDRAMVHGRNDDGTRRSQEDIMTWLHGWTEAWAEQHRGKPFGELARVGLTVRADTLALLSELTDEQLLSVIPGAPWADHTIGGIIAANASHGRMHFKWAKEGTLTPPA